MRTFLFKTEPGSFSYSDLVREKRTAWTGVSNPAALKALRTARTGDRVLIYHTGNEKCIVGLAEVCKSPYQDPDQPGLTPAGEPKHAAVDLKPVKAATSPVTLATIKADPRFAGFALVTQSRLSVMEVPQELAKTLLTLAGL